MRLLPGSNDMTNEDFERTKEFILQQQAQFAAGIEELREAQAQASTVITRTGEIVTRLANVTHEGFKDVNAKINSLIDSQINLTDAKSRTDEKINSVDSKINALVDSQIGLTEAQSRTDEKIKALVASQATLTDAQSRTTQDLKNLIAVVDRHLSEGRNGN